MSPSGPDRGSATIRLRRFASREELDAALADRIERYVAGADRLRPTALMLSGGSTPRAAYGALATRPSPAGVDGVHFFYSDERLVPLTADASNYRMSRAMLDAWEVPESRRVYVRTHLPAEEAAHDYAQRLEAMERSGIAVQLGLLGLGADGHTAGLFTTEDVARARGRLAIAVRRADGLEGVTVTPDFLARISEVLFVVAGAEKRPALAALLAKDPELVAWEAVRRCRNVTIWAEPESAPA